MHLDIKIEQNFSYCFYTDEEIRKSENILEEQKRKTKIECNQYKNRFSIFQHTPLITDESTYIIPPSSRKLRGQLDE